MKVQTAKLGAVLVIMAGVALVLIKQQGRAAVRPVTAQRRQDIPGVINVPDVLTLPEEFDA
jgi:hypothetical protein